MVLEQGQGHENSFPNSPTAILMADAASRAGTFKNLKSKQDKKKHNPTVLTFFLDSDHFGHLITLWPNTFEHSTQEQGGMASH